MVFLPFCLLSSAVIEHTNRVIFLEDDDVAAVSNGRLSIHRIKRTVGDHPARAIQTLQMELQQIMKGKSKRERVCMCAVHVRASVCPSVSPWILLQVCILFRW